MNGDPIYSPNKAKNPSLTTKFTKKNWSSKKNKQIQVPKQAKHLSKKHNRLNKPSGWWF